jgi:Matrixin
MSTVRHLQISSAVFRGSVVEVQSFQAPSDGQLYTRTTFRVNEVFKGTVPTTLSLVHRGGYVAGWGQSDGFAPRFKVGEERLLFVSRNSDATLYCTRGEASAPLLSTGAASKSATAETSAASSLLEELRALSSGAALPGGDVTDQAAYPLPLHVSGGTSGPQPLVPTSTATNLLVDNTGIPARFILPDRGEAIPYLVDADYLPSGISQTQALNAVKTVLAAWSNVTSLKYTFAGIQSFGTAAGSIKNGDGFLRIQLHDHYNFVGGGSGGDVLGIGGHVWVNQALTPGWTTGGNVQGNDFHKTVNGFVVLQHTNISMQNLSTFTEVLCHEVGHSIGLDHSSINAAETNPILKQAIMFFQVHADGRGAAVTNFDINVSRQIHPPTNTPPYCYDRFMDIISTPTPVTNIPGMNVVQVRGYSLEPKNLTLATTDATAFNGTFSLVRSNLTYVLPGLFGDAPRVDPASGQYYDRIYARYSDGVNASPFVSVSVVSLNEDDFSEGVPNNWRQAYFGSIDPSAGPERHGTNDFDGDGFSNLQEFQLGSNPTNKISNLLITSFSATNLQWQAKAYEVYELYSSTNLSAWARVKNPLVPTNSIGVAFAFTNGSPKQFFRIQKVP